MERRVKERLIGAVVLMAAAIILNEMLLLGSRSGDPAVEPRAAGDASLKTYTIDLNRSPGATQTPVDERAPPPESPIASTPPQVEPPTPDDRVETAQPSPESVLSPAAPPPRVAQEATGPVRETPPPAASATSQERPAPIASPPITPTTRGWAVQLGSFSSQVTAERMVGELAGQGHKAFVMPVKSGGATLYRVRIGPFAEREAANATLREVKSRSANAAVVAHP